MTNFRRTLLPWKVLRKRFGAKASAGLRRFEAGLQALGGDGRHRAQFLRREGNAVFLKPPAQLGGGLSTARPQGGQGLAAPLPFRQLHDEGAIPVYPALELLEAEGGCGKVTGQL